MTKIPVTAEGEAESTRLDEEITLQVRKLVVEGNLYKVIREQLGIKESTWDSWVYRDTQGFRTNLTRWKAERFLRQAEDNVPVLLDAKSENVKADMTKFILETGGKEVYSKKQEIDIDLSHISDADLDARIKQSLAALSQATVSPTPGGEGPALASEPA